MLNVEIRKETEAEKVERQTKAKVNKLKKQRTKLIRQRKQNRETRAKYSKALEDLMRDSNLISAQILGVDSDLADLR